MRELRETDMRQVALLVSRALAAEEGKSLPSEPTEAAIESWRRRVAEADRWAIVELDAGSVVGICDGMPEWDFENNCPIPGIGHLSGLFVEPTQWGHGHGRRLLRAGTSRLAALGHESGRLWSAIDNERANSLYESEGWLCTGRHQRASDGREEIEFAISLRRTEEPVAGTA